MLSQLVERHAIDDGHLVAVLQVAADPGEVDALRDAVPGQLGRLADAGEHQQLRRVEGAAGEDDLQPRRGMARLARRVARRRRAPGRAARP